MDIKIYTDGASRNNPGESASGYLIIDNNEEILECFYNGIKTNNEAEYIAVISALDRLIKEEKESFPIIIHSDSKLIINQLIGSYKVKDLKLMELRNKALTLSKQFMSCNFKNVLREDKNIKKVDTALNVLLDNIEKSEKQ